MFQDLIYDIQGQPLDFDRDNFITPIKDDNDLLNRDSIMNGYDTDSLVIDNTPRAIGNYLRSEGIKNVDIDDPYSLAEAMYKISNDWQVVYYDDVNVDFNTLESQHDMNSGDNIDDIAYLLSDTTED